MRRAPRIAVLTAGALIAGTAACSSEVVGSASPAPAALDLETTRVASYAAGQPHAPGDVDYAESPPVGGPHASVWADCTGSVYDVDIRHENAVHSLEHGAVWVTYDPDLLGEGDVATLAALVEGVPYRLMSPYAGLGVPVSIQAWNHQLLVDSADDARLEQFADLLTSNPDTTPEPGATCENPAFLEDPETA